MHQRPNRLVRGFAEVSAGAWCAPVRTRPGRDEPASAPATYAFFNLACVSCCYFSADCFGAGRRVSNPSVLGALIKNESKMLGVSMDQQPSAVSLFQNLIDMGYINPSSVDPHGGLPSNYIAVESTLAFSTPPVNVSSKQGGKHAELGSRPKRNNKGTKRSRR